MSLLAATAFATVDSFNSRLGHVRPQAGDYNCSQITGCATSGPTPTGVTPTPTKTATPTPVPTPTGGGICGPCLPGNDTELLYDDAGVIGSSPYFAADPDDGGGNTLVTFGGDVLGSVANLTPNFGWYRFAGNGGMEMDLIASDGPAALTGIAATNNLSGGALELESFFARGTLVAPLRAQAGDVVGYWLSRATTSNGVSPLGGSDLGTYLTVVDGTTVAGDPTTYGLIHRLRTKTLGGSQFATAADFSADGNVLYGPLALPSYPACDVHTDPVTGAILCPTPSPTPTATGTATPTATVTLTATKTVTPTATVTVTPTADVCSQEANCVTPTGTPTATRSPTPTLSPTATVTVTPTPTVTVTPVASCASCVPGADEDVIFNDAGVFGVDTGDFTYDKSIPRLSVNARFQQSANAPTLAAGELLWNSDVTLTAVSEQTETVPIVGSVLRSFSETVAADAGSPALAAHDIVEGGLVQDTNSIDFSAFTYDASGAYWKLHENHGIVTRGLTKPPTVAVYSVMGEWVNVNASSSSDTLEILTVGGKSTDVSTPATVRHIRLVGFSNTGGGTVTTEIGLEIPDLGGTTGKALEQQGTDDINRFAGISRFNGRVVIGATASPTKTVTPTPFATPTGPAATFTVTATTSPSATPTPILNVVGLVKILPTACGLGTDGAGIIACVTATVTPTPTPTVTATVTVTISPTPTATKTAGTPLPVGQATADAGTVGPPYANADHQHAVTDPFDIPAATRTVTPTSTAATATPSPTPSPTATATSTAASPTSTAATPTFTPAFPLRTPQPGLVVDKDVLVYGATFGAPQEVEWIAGLNLVNSATRYYSLGAVSTACGGIGRLMLSPGCMERLGCGLNPGGAAIPDPGTYTVRFSKILAGTNTQIDNDKTLTLSGNSVRAQFFKDYAVGDLCWNAQDILCLRVDPSAIAPGQPIAKCTSRHRSY